MISGKVEPTFCIIQDFLQELGMILQFITLGTLKGRGMFLPWILLEIHANCIAIRDSVALQMNKLEF
jgi:hypothetical protein